MRILIAIVALLVLAGAALLLFRFAGGDEAGLGRGPALEEEAESTPRPQRVARPERAPHSTLGADQAVGAAATTTEPIEEPSPPEEIEEGVIVETSDEEIPALVHGRLRPLPGGNILGLSPWLMATEGPNRSDQDQMGRVEESGFFEMGITPDRLHDLVVRDPWGHELLRVRDLRVALGEDRDLGDLYVDSRAVELSLRFHHGVGLAGRAGLVQAVPVDGNEVLATGVVKLDGVLKRDSGGGLITEARRLVVPALPVEIRILIDGVRLLRYRLDQPEAVIVVQPGIRKEVVFDPAVTIDPEDRLVLEFHLDREFGVGDDYVIEGERVSGPVALPDYGDYRVVLRHDDLEDGHVVESLIIGQGLDRETVRVSEDDPGPIRLSLSPQAIEILRDQVGRKP
ncbi:MAG: hypothetical protein H6807_12490 [Planctomycetes bacterium]|nr:hypothetical protein [Planctomycetota bacterium]